MPHSSRPLSPHLQVYRPQITSVLSIIHRGTGVALSGGIPVLVYWLLAVAAGEAEYAAAGAWLGSIAGRVLLFGWTFCFFFHFCNGLRHLAWDIGRGFEIRDVNRSGWLVVIAAVAMTALTWFFALGLGAGSGGGS